MVREVHTVDEAAVMLGLSPARVRALLSQGRITARKWGSAWMIPAAELARFEPKTKAAEREVNGPDQERSRGAAPDRSTGEAAH